MHKIMLELTKVITAALRVAPICLLVVLLGGVFEHIGDTIMGIVFLLLVTAELLSLAHTIWDGARFELALSDVVKDGGETLPRVTALEPLPNMAYLSKAGVISTLTGTALCRLSMTTRMVILVFAGVAGIVLAICLLILGVLYGHLWLKRQMSDDEMLTFEINYRWAPGDKAVVKVLGPGSPRYFRLRKNERALPFYFSGL